MGLLLDAAIAWDSLKDISYTLELGRKNKRYTVFLTFRPEDFYHLAGMQYAEDVDFGLRRSEYYGAKLVSAILSGKLKENHICKAREWEKIESRLKAIIKLLDTIENDFIISAFDPKNVKGLCSIQAEYVIKNTSSGETFFVFMSNRAGVYYCKSAFHNSYLDYTQNQAMMAILMVSKETSSEKTVLRKHPHFLEDS